MSNEAPTDALRLVQAIRDWLREPDNAESFSFNDLVEWLNRRPVGLVAAALESLAAAPASPLPGGGYFVPAMTFDHIAAILWSKGLGEYATTMSRNSIALPAAPTGDA